MNRYIWNHSFTIRARTDADGQPSESAAYITGPGRMVWLPDAEAARLRADFGVDALLDSPVSSPSPSDDDPPAPEAAPSPASGAEDVALDETQDIAPTGDEPGDLDEIDDMTKPELWAAVKDKGLDEGVSYQTASADDLRAILRA